MMKNPTISHCVLLSALTYAFSLTPLDHTSQITHHSSHRYIFRFYLGFDKADELYDTGDAWSLMREEFKSRARYRMSTQFISEKDIEAILDTQLTLKIMHFDHLQGAPTQVVSQLMLSAYVNHARAMLYV